MKNNKGLIIAFILLIICFGINTIMTIISDNNDNNYNEEYTKDTKVVINDDQYIAVALFSNKSNLTGILPEAETRDLDIEVLRTDGKGSRSFAIKDYEIYYLDKDYYLNVYNTKYDTNKVLAQIEILGFADLYITNNGIVIFSEENTYLYDFSTSKVISLNIKSPYADDMRYYNKANNTIYYPNEDGNLTSYNFINKKEKVLFDYYYIYGTKSNDNYLVLRKDNNYFLYDYTNNKLNKVLDTNNEIICMKEASIIYTHNNKLISKNIITDIEEELYTFKLDNSNNEYVGASYSFHSLEEVYVATYTNMCSSGICGPVVKDEYIYSFNTKKITKITDKLKLSMLFESINY